MKITEQQRCISRRSAEPRDLETLFRSDQYNRRCK